MASIREQNIKTLFANIKGCLIWGTTSEGLSGILHGRRDNSFMFYFTFLDIDKELIPQTMLKNVLIYDNKNIKTADGQFGAIRGSTCLSMMNNLPPNSAEVVDVTKNFLSILDGTGQLQLSTQIHSSCIFSTQRAESCFSTTGEPGPCFILKWNFPPHSPTVMLAPLCKTSAFMMLNSNCCVSGSGSVPTGEFKIYPSLSSCSAEKKTCKPYALDSGTGCCENNPQSQSKSVYETFQDCILDNTSTCKKEYAVFDPGFSKCCALRQANQVKPTSKTEWYSTVEDCQKNSKYTDFCNVKNLLLDPTGMFQSAYYTCSMNDTWGTNTKNCSTEDIACQEATKAANCGYNYCQVWNKKNKDSSMWSQEVTCLPEENDTGNAVCCNNNGTYSISNKGTESAKGSCTCFAGYKGEQCLESICEGVSCNYPYGHCDPTTGKCICNTNEYIISDPSNCTPKCAKTGFPPGKDIGCCSCRDIPTDTSNGKVCKSVFGTENVSSIWQEHFAQNNCSDLGQACEKVGYFKDNYPPNMPAYQNGSTLEKCPTTKIETPKRNWNVCCCESDNSKNAVCRNAVANYYSNYPNYSPM